MWQSIFAGPQKLGHENQHIHKRLVANKPIVGSWC